MPRAVGALPRAQHQPLGRLGGAVALAVVFLGSLTPGFSRSLQTPAFAAPLPAPAPAQLADERPARGLGFVGRDSFPAQQRRGAQLEEAPASEEATAVRCGRLMRLDVVAFWRRLRMSPRQRG